MISQFFTRSDSRLLFLAEFLKSGIRAQRVKSAVVRIVRLDLFSACPRLRAAAPERLFLAAL